MQPLSFFFDRIGQDILRGTTKVTVTRDNYEILHEMQSPGYTFSEIESTEDKLNICLSCHG